MTGNDRRRLTRAERRADDAGTVMNAPRVPAPHEMAPFTIADAVAGLVLPRGAHFEWDTPLASDLERNAAAQRLAALESEHAALTDAANAAVAYISGLHSSQRDRRAVDVMNQLMRALRPGRDVK